MEVLDDLVLVGVQFLNQPVVVIAWQRQVFVDAGQQLQNNLDCQVAQGEVPGCDAVSLDAL